MCVPKLEILLILSCSMSLVLADKGENSTALAISDNSTSRQSKCTHTFKSIHRNY